MEIIILQTNTYYSEESWIESFQRLVPTYYEKFRLKFFINTAQLSEMIQYADHCFCFNINPNILLNSSRLKTLYHGISDTGYIDHEKLPDNLRIFSSAGHASKIIAEYCLMMALMATRNIQTASIAKQKRKWDQTPFLDTKFVSLAGYKIGILGLGNNGKEIASLFQTIGCKVAGYSNSPKEGTVVDKWYGITELNQILEFSDILIIALPLRQDTINLITYDKLKIMGESSIIINVARGAIINEDDLVRILKEKCIKAAVLDVTQEEPLSKKSSLWKLDNCFITPHIAGNINSVSERIQEDYICKITKYYFSSPVN